MLKVLVTGAEGQLGQCFQAVAKEFPLYDLIFVTKRSLDITKAEGFQKIYEHKSFDGIINCAAYSKVDQAELDKNKAYEINEKGIQNLVDFSEKNSLFIINFSTDYVFNSNNKSSFKEEELTNPINIYAESKLAGEDILKNAICPNITIRTSWLFSPYGNNFVNTILKLSSYKKILRVVNDQLGRPTYGIDLARIVLDKLSQPNFFDFDCYHYANKGAVSWYGFAKKIIEISNKNCFIKPCSTSEHETLAVRPKYSILDTNRIENHLSLSIPSWENALERCLNKYNLNEVF